MALCPIEKSAHFIVIVHCSLVAADLSSLYFKVLAFESCHEFRSHGGAVAEVSILILRCLVTLRNKLIQLEFLSILLDI